MTGVMGNMIESNANFSTGHIKITTRAYAESEDQVPNDLALLDAADLVSGLAKRYPDMQFVERIRFGGLLDIPDENGETRAQGPTAGLAVDLLSPDSTEIERLNIKQAIMRGRIPAAPGEVLISDTFAGNLDVEVNSPATVIGSTMHGSLTMENFTIVGTVRFGVAPMDKGAIIADIEDIRLALDMQDAAGEVLGFFNGGRYRDEEAVRITSKFNEGTGDTDDEFAPFARALRDQNGLAEYLDLADSMLGIVSAVFVLAMSVVLWNMGLIGGLRRYGEVGVRLAIGEEKGRIYRSMVVESILIGIAGSALGTAIGLGAAWYLQTYGIDIGGMLDNSSMMLSSVMRARITGASFYIGFIPGLISTVLGSALAGIGIYRRQTAQLFKELEA
jgi:putative ABC transport system permease protein